MTMGQLEEWEKERLKKLVQSSRKVEVGLRDVIPEDFDGRVIEK